MPTLGEMFPNELAQLQQRAREMSAEIGRTIEIDCVARKGDSLVAAVKAEGMAGTVYYAVPIRAQAKRRFFSRGGAA
jgi:hypothetical protein